ncbi:MAG TPA: LysM peptidoglycan-binding domain-containing protein [Anaerolineae bacterium]|nr:LysM peptidoglycan-binding domain-containing protein [Anaerolineae bacterium]
MPVEFISPSPDPTRSAPPATTETYIVQNGDTLGGIALEYNTTPEALAQMNGVADLASIGVGQSLSVPLDGITQTGPALKIAPDSEVVYGPGTVGFDVEDFVARTNGYVRSYTEEVEGEVLTGAQIVQLVAERYSVGPRVLLALIEYRGGWLSSSSPDATALYYPAGHAVDAWSGLHQQLTWAADHLNDGYYGWKTRDRETIRLSDSTRVRIAPGLNAGTIGLQSLLAIDSSADAWAKDVGPDGFVATYRAWFGDPFARAVESTPLPLLYQPELALPWPQGETWYFTGGPHGAWAPGSGWGALDFMAPDGGLGCYQSDAWVTSMSDGLVVRSRAGEVLVDLDGDGHEQTGWVILYLHVEERDRVAAGALVRTGDRVGHPSCEGGASTATHLHVARRYDGEWIAAGGPAPFSIGGWIPAAASREYDGALQKEGVRKDACECRDDAVNGITH